MRFVVREMAYEKLVVSGRCRLGAAVEQWRLTRAVDGYHILRVDHDTRPDNSYLYHLILNPAGEPDRLLFRLFRPGLTVRGNVLFGDGLALQTRLVNNQSEQIELDYPAGTYFHFPALVAFSLLRTVPPTDQRCPALTLAKEQLLALQPATLRAGLGQLTVEWANQQQTVWLDEMSRPVRWLEHDSLSGSTNFADLSNLHEVKYEKFFPFPFVSPVSRL